MMKKMIILILFLCAAHIQAYQYADRILAEMSETQNKALSAHQIFLDAKQKVLQEDDGKDYREVRKLWFECEDLYGNQSQECREINQKLENALYELSKKSGYQEYVSALENNNYQMNKLVGLRLMVDCMSKSSYESKEEALFDALDALPPVERDVASPLWIEYADNPAKVAEKVKNDLRDFVQEIAKD